MTWSVYSKLIFIDTEMILLVCRTSIDAFKSKLIDLLVVHYAKQSKYWQMLVKKDDVFFERSAEIER